MNNAMEIYKILDKHSVGIRDYTNYFIECMCGKWSFTNENVRAEILETMHRKHVAEEINNAISVVVRANYREFQEYVERVAKGWGT